MAAALAQEIFFHSHWTTEFTAVQDAPCFLNNQTVWLYLWHVRPVLCLLTAVFSVTSKSRMYSRCGLHSVQICEHTRGGALRLRTQCTNEKNPGSSVFQDDAMLVNQRNSTGRTRHEIRRATLNNLTHKIPCGEAQARRKILFRVSPRGTCCRALRTARSREARCARGDRHSSETPRGEAATQSFHSE